MLLSFLAVFVPALHPSFAQPAGGELLPTVPALAPEDDLAATDTIVVIGKEGGAAAELPGSFTVVDGEQLERRRMRTIRDASIAVPNLFISEFSARRLSFPFLRGVGSGQGDPAVITYIDGIPQFGFGGVNLPLMDVSRVEFLRGPQGTLYGRNALGGLINVVTRRPGPTADFRGRVGGGNFDAFEAEVSALGSVTDGVGGGLSGLYSRREGYTTNDFTGNDVDFRDGFFGRAQVQFAPTDQSLLRVSVFGESARDGGFVLSDLDGLRANPFRINQDFEGVTERDVISPNVEWSHYGKDFETTVLGSFQSWEVLETSDFDFSPLDAVRRRTDEEQDYGYLEVRLASNERSREDRDSSPAWLVGLSGFTSDSQRSARNAFRPGSAALGLVPGISLESGEFDDTGVGLFGQTTFAVSEQVDLTAGVRVDFESKEAQLEQSFSIGGFPVAQDSQDLDEDFDEILPKVAATWYPDDDTTLYAQAARGFKAGGFNLSAPAGQRIFGPETSWTYEVGAKFAVGAARVGAALFLVDWKDMQLSQFDPQAGGFVSNAGESTSRGVEIDVAVPLTSSLKLTSAVGYIDSEFDSFIDSFGSDVSGNSLPFAPEGTVRIGAEYTTQLSQGGEFFVAGDLSWVGDFYYDPSNLGEESFELVDLAMGYRRGRWGLSVALRNAFDEEYFPIAFQANPGDPSAFVAENGAPRTVFVSVQYGG